MALTAGCLWLAALLAPASCGASAEPYGHQSLAVAGSSYAPSYESELLAAAYSQQHHGAGAYGQSQPICVITIKPYNSTSSSSYSAALAATSNSYLSDYVSR